MKILVRHPAYTLIDRFSDDLESLRRHVRRLNGSGAFQVDNIKGMGSVYLCNDAQFIRQMFLFHRELQSLGLLQKTKPSYTFLRQYLPGARLPLHTDRDECEYNISFVIEGQEEFILKDSSGSTHQISLGENQALIYSGTQQEHGREQVDHYLCVALFHFVKDVVEVTD